MTEDDEEDPVVLADKYHEQTKRMAKSLHRKGLHMKQLRENSTNSSFRSPRSKLSSKIQHSASCRADNPVTLPPTGRKT